MASPEIKVTYRVIAVIGSIIVAGVLIGYIYLRWKAPHLFRFSDRFTEYVQAVHKDSIPGAVFITGSFSGCENIYPDPLSGDIFVTTLSGYLHQLNTDTTGNLREGNKIQLGGMALGITRDRYGQLIVAVSPGDFQDWSLDGGSVTSFSEIPGEGRPITGRLQGINGIASDGKGNIFVAFSNLRYLSPSGGIVRISVDTNASNSSVDTVLSWEGLVNGLYFDTLSHQLLFSNTLQGVFIFHEDREPDTVYTKMHFLEAVDDICTDSHGRVWMADPGNATVKMILPGTDKLIRFKIKGVGQVSSCRTRIENGVEVLYMTELKQKQALRSIDFDGRGVFSCPVGSLLGLLPPDARLSTVE